MNHLRARYLTFITLAACSSDPADESPNRPSESVFFPAFEPPEQGQRDDHGANPWLDGGGTGSSSNAAMPEVAGTTPVDATDAPTEAQGGASSSATTGSESPDPTLSGSGGTPDEPDEPARLLLVEYKEGTGSDKRLGLRNDGLGSKGPCQILVYANGSSDPWRTLLIDPMPDVGETIVLCTSTELESGCTHPMSSSPFNGDDALVVTCSDVITDSFGQRGVDPGSAWISQTNPEITTKDQWLARCTSKPDLDPSDPFDLGVDWVAVPPEDDVSGALQLCHEALGMGGSVNEP